MTEQVARRDYTTEELHQMFPNKKHLTCPECETTKFRAGPEGGTSKNFLCENGHGWNCNAFGMQAIGDGSAMELRQGWGRPPTRSRAHFHYFRDGHSLCNKYADPGPLHMQIQLTGDLADHLQHQDDKCVRCTRKL